MSLKIRIAEVQGVQSSELLNSLLLEALGKENRDDGGMRGKTCVKAH